MKFGRSIGIAMLLSSSVALATTSSSKAPPPPPAQQEAEPEFHWQVGPKKLDLGHDVQIDLPVGYAFLGMPEADQLLKKQGSFNNQSTLGILIAAVENSTWEVIVDYEDAGYVKDDEKIDADALIKSFREGAVEQNKEREAHGFPPLTVGDWAEVPRYDRATHRLIWAIPAISSRGTTINYNTRVLGRHGYVSLDLLTSPEKLADEKVNATTMLAATSFKNGARYEDFDKKKDKVAEYGLMGLIAGGVGLAAVKVAKVGLLAGLLKFLIAGWKIVAAFFVALFAGIKRFFTGEPAPPKETKLPPPGNDGNPSS